MITEHSTGCLQRPIQMSLYSFIIFNELLMISQQRLMPIHRDDTIAYHNLKSGIHLTSVPQRLVDELQHKAL